MTKKKETKAARIRRLEREVLEAAERLSVWLGHAALYPQSPPLAFVLQRAVYALKEARAAK